jgi:hypothetical protein
MLNNKPVRLLADNFQIIIAYIQEEITRQCNPLDLEFIIFFGILFVSGRTILEFTNFEIGDLLCHIINWLNTN